MIPTRFSKPLLLCTVCIGLTGCSGWQWPSLEMPADDRANGAPRSIVPEDMQSKQPVVSSWANPDEKRMAGTQPMPKPKHPPMKEMPVQQHIVKANSTTPLDARVAHLEREVTLMRQDMDRLLPALQRLIAGQEDVAMIVSDLNRRDAGMPVSASTAHHKAPVTRQSSLKRIKPTPVIGTSGVPATTYKGPSRLADIRTGEHPGKTRLVLDVGSETPFRYDLDNNERLLVIELGNAPLSKAMTSSLRKSQFVSAYKAEATEQGSRVIVQLKKPARILHAETLKPTGGRGARIMFDIGGV
jgi:hypothetical protein